MLGERRLRGTRVLAVQRARRQINAHRPATDCLIGYVTLICAVRRVGGPAATGARRRAGTRGRRDRKWPSATATDVTATAASWGSSRRRFRGHTIAVSCRRPGLSRPAQDQRSPLTEILEAPKPKRPPTALNDTGTVPAAPAHPSLGGDRANSPVVLQAEHDQISSGLGGALPEGLGRGSIAGASTSGGPAASQVGDGSPRPGSPPPRRPGSGYPQGSQPNSRRSVCGGRRPDGPWHSVARVNVASPRSSRAALLTLGLQVPEIGLAVSPIRGVCRRDGRGRIRPAGRLLMKHCSPL
jgi:hypothetical protein